MITYSRIIYRSQPSCEEFNSFFLKFEKKYPSFDAGKDCHSRGYVKYLEDAIFHGHIKLPTLIFIRSLSDPMKFKGQGRCILEINQFRITSKSAGVSLELCQNNCKKFGSFCGALFWRLGRCVIYPTELIDDVGDWNKTGNYVTIPKIITSYSTEEDPMFDGYCFLYEGKHPKESIKVRTTSKRLTIVGNGECSMITITRTNRALRYVAYVDFTECRDYCEILGNQCAGFDFSSDSFCRIFVRTHLDYSLPMFTLNGDVVHSLSEITGCYFSKNDHCYRQHISDQPSTILLGEFPCSENPNTLRLVKSDIMVDKCIDICEKLPNVTFSSINKVIDVFCQKILRHAAAKHYLRNSYPQKTQNCVLRQR
jgi:hypothetical protein